MRPSHTFAGLALASLLVVGASACGGSGSSGSAATTTTKPAGKVEVNTDDADNPTVEYTDGDGTKTEFGASLPKDWPDELAPPDTITIVSSSTSEVDGKTQLFVSGESTESFDAVYQGLKAQFTDAGYDITSDLATDEGDFAGLEASGNGVKASVTVAGDPDTKKVSVLFTVTPRG